MKHFALMFAKWIILMCMDFDDEQARYYFTGLSSPEPMLATNPSVALSTTNPQPISTISTTKREREVWEPRLFRAGSVKRQSTFY